MGFLLNSYNLRLQSNLLNMSIITLMKTYQGYDRPSNALLWFKYFFYFLQLIKIGYIPFLIFPQLFILKNFKPTEVEVVILKC